MTPNCLDFLNSRKRTKIGCIVGTLLEPENTQSMLNVRNMSHKIVNGKLFYVSTYQAQYREEATL